jgi:hypothetical protein
MLAKLKLTPHLLLALLALLFAGLIVLAVRTPSTPLSIAIKFAILLYLALGAATGRRSAGYILAALCGASAVFTAMQLAEGPLLLSVEDAFLVGWALVLFALAIYLVVSPGMRRLYASSKSPNVDTPPGP